MSLLGFDSFCAEYERQLIDAIKTHPEEYPMPLEEVPAIMSRMRVAIARNSFNKDSIAIRKTCQRLGIRSSYKGIRDYIYVWDTEGAL